MEDSVSRHEPVKRAADGAIFDRYADAVIGGQPELFDAIEVRGVRAVGTGDDVEVNDADPGFYSVYLHYKAGGEFEGVQCCADHDRRHDAIAYAEELSQKHGWPVFDYSQDKKTLPCDLITDALLLDAAKIDDPDMAFAGVQDAVGITDGSLADISVGIEIRDRWPKESGLWRLHMLYAWRQAEQAHRIDYGLDARRDTALTLAGLRCLQRQLSMGGVPAEVAEIMEEWEGVNVPEIVRRIDTLCEDKVNT